MRSAQLRGWAAMRVMTVAMAVMAMSAFVGYAQAEEPVGAAPHQDPTAVPVGGKVEAENACYVRLPDLPAAEGRYGGFGAYNWDTGILALVGGAEKKSEDNTYVYSDLYAMDMTSTGSWKSLQYGQSGYNREPDRGCREMSSVAVDAGLHLSVGGKDGCAGPDSSNGDIKGLNVGASASTSGVSWVPNSSVSGNLPQELDDGGFKLVRNFAVWDEVRERLVFGQGTFDDAVDQESQSQVYQATRQGSKWNVRQMFPTGDAPIKRFGTCAAYVNQPDTGVDGVIVLGGQQGGPVDTTSYNEVWWLDFSGRDAGEWSNITARFANQDQIGYRREGACAYDQGTQTFYSWMGRASSSVPDGASRSAGFWRVDLSTIGDEQQSLTWERLAADNLAGIKGRRLIPSVWDPINKRAFVIGGRNSLDEYTDAWVLYPDVTGAECQALDYTTMAPTPTPPPTNTPDTPPTSSTPSNGTPSGGTPTPTVTPVTPEPGGPKPCDFMDGRVPQSAINYALTNQAEVGGWGQLCFPNRPAGPFNGFREYLSLRNIGKPYHPLYNSVIYKCGCP